MSMRFNRDAFEPVLYRAYLIRLWAEGSPGTWRASVQSVASGAIVHFASMDALFNFLRSETTEGECDMRPDE